jgi:hypothetical protein
VSFSANLTLKGKLFAMKKKRFSIEQIAAVLKQAELGMPVADLICSSFDLIWLKRGRVRWLFPHLSTKQDAAVPVDFDVNDLLSPIGISGIDSKGSFLWKFLQQLDDVSYRWSF